MQPPEARSWIIAISARASWRAPYFDLHSGLIIPCVVTWDRETGEFTRVVGPRGFATWQEAEEAGRFFRAPDD